MIKHTGSAFLISIIGFWLCVYLVLYLDHAVSALSAVGMIGFFMIAMRCCAIFMGRFTGPYLDWADPSALK